MAVVALATVVTLLLATRGEPTSAGAAVVRGDGYQATVLGWSSWYGSYDLAGLGRTWCIDHGIRAPDAAFGYVPTATPDVDADTQAAVSWALARHGDAGGAQSAAALMLAVHDLRDAVYPLGPLDLQRMSPTDLAGFGGAEAEILNLARAIVADARAHGHLRGPLRLTATVDPSDPSDPPEPGDTGTLAVTLTDSAGAAVPGVTAHVHAEGASLLDGGHRDTGADGSAAFSFRAGDGANRFSVRVVAPDPTFHAWGPTTVPAQRVARPGTVDLTAAAGFDTTPPTGRLRLVKTDASTDAPVAGAVFDLRTDVDGDGDFESSVLQVTSAERPVEIGDLVPGDYELREVEAPDGYRISELPAAVHVPAGASIEVTIANHPTSSVRFQKRPASPTPRSLEGAEFVVRGPVDHTLVPPPVGDDPPDGGEDHTDPLPSVDDDPGTRPPEVGRCTTDAAGACSLAPDALDGGRDYCWRETRAPAGFAVAEGGCFVAGPAASVVTVEVVEPLLEKPPPPEAPDVDRPPPTSPDAATPPPTPPADRDAPPSRSASPPPADGSPLPVTGSSTGTLVTVGAAMVLVGIIVAAVAWRRGVV